MCTIHTKNNNIQIMMVKETNETNEELFESLLEIYHEGLEEKLRGSEFVFESFVLLHYNLHKVSSINDYWDGSYIHSPDRLKIEMQQ